MSGLRQDVIYGLRNLRRRPGFTLVALVVLGSAIGLNTSLFTFFNALALRPWPVPDPGRVVRIFSRPPQVPGGMGFSLAEARHFSEHAKSFTGFAVRQDGATDRTGLSYEHVNAAYFDVLRVPMALGRGFRPEEDRADGPAAVAVLSHEVWRRRFGADPNIVGRSLPLHDIPFTVIGVAAPEFTGTAATRNDVWIPFPAALLLQPGDASLRERFGRPDHCCFSLAGRLAPGAPTERARAELEHLSGQFRAPLAMESHPIVLTGTAFLENPSPQTEVRSAIALMFAAVTLVLLLACANVGNLLLARAAARRQEIAVRLSLGASRARVVRQLLTESLLVAGAAAALGIGIAFFLPSWLVSTLDPSVTLRFEPDGNVLPFTVGIVVVTCLAFGLAPALHCTRASVGSALGVRSETSGARTSLRGALLATQVAVSVVLLAAAGLLVRGSEQAQSQDPGFAVQGVALVSFDMDLKSYDAARRRVLVERLEAELASLPGSPPYGLTRHAPLGGSGMVTGVWRRGQTASEAQSVTMMEVSPGYLHVLRIPILSGRNFNPADDPEQVVLVSEALARRQWPGEAPVGQMLLAAGKDQPREVVGVVRDARTRRLDGIEPTLYVPLGRSALPQVLIRDEGPSTSRTMATLAARLDPQAQARVRPLSDQLQVWLKPSRIGAMIAGGVGALALALAAIGLSGVFAYSVQLRTREIGIRMALGARSADVLRLVLGSSSRALLTGVALGLAGAIGASQVLRSHLYGLSPVDPLAFGGVALFLTAAGVAASYFPARRAIRVDPTVALRCE